MWFFTSLFDTLFPARHTQILVRAMTFSSLLNISKPHKLKLENCTIIALLPLSKRNSASLHT